MGSERVEGAAGRVAVAAPHAAAVEAAEEAVRGGGNAIDAALAAAAALTVVYPHQCSLGGDLIALVHDERSGDGPVAVLSAGTVPAGLDLEALAGAPMPRRGIETVTVPGAVAGWRAIAALGAARPLGEALRAAARTAAKGAPVSPGLARAIEAQREAVLADPGLREVFAPEGEPLGEGDVFVQPALAATLEELAEDPASFYTGAVAARLAAGLAGLGGAHTAADLAAHEAETVPALGRELGGVHWWVAPPPSQGALLLGVLPAALEAAASGREAGLVEASLRGMDVRDRELGDPRTAPVDVRAMTDLRVSSTEPAPPSGRALGDTVAVTAVDGAGLSVTLIQSVFQTFGAGLLERSTGIVLHNRGASFSTDPASPARIAHGSRPPHTLCPLIVQAPGLTAAVGCQGGRAQPWILAQAAPDLAEPSANPAAVLARPRWVVGAKDLGHDVPTLVGEPGTAGAVNAASALGVPVDRRDGPQDEAGHVQVARRAAGRLDAATDPRADGAAAVLHP
ncbi:gamma-glutamyltransferase 2 [Actinocorallia herbida]|uniref:Gamma-glutamyltransferase 2 n=1 Tax=Actinocorallia herbida TaxID=58109 RepID=A0A3N1D6C6_9ACTN|nr:gamma-glutamyltransferase [Actinocorallia herbida]ROO89091.1 gamma-glutamyltransferase 2 [Actinocorallia herbida]